MHVVAIFICILPRKIAYTFSKIVFNFFVFGEFV